MNETEALRAPLPLLVGSARPFVPMPDDGMARVCRVYDGDTLTLLCRISGRLVTSQLRIDGVDAPEMKCAAQKYCATLVRDVVRELLLGREVSVVADATDKYGRLLGDLTWPDAEDRPETTLRHYLLSRGLVRSYDGKARAAWSPETLTTIAASAEIVLAELRERPA